MVCETRQFIFKCFSLELSYAYYTTKYICFSGYIAEHPKPHLRIRREEKKDLLIIPIKELS